MSKIKDERKNILDLCNVLLNNTKNVIDDVDKHEIVRKIALAIQDRTEEIEKICNVEKYSIMFNGEVGKGKTTAISSLFDLFDKNAQKINEVSILGTSSGRTTPCETVIIQDNGSASTIKIEKMDNSEFDKILDIYCNKLFVKEEVLPKEYIRIIDNMLELNVSDTNEEKLNGLMKRIGCDATEFKALKNKIKQYVTEFINYENRIKTAIVIDNENTIEHLKNKIRDINNGKDKEVPFPKKVTLTLNTNEVDLNLPEYINQIIDTRGIDSPERKDIQDSMREKNIITIMCDEIPAFGGSPNIVGILKNELKEENEDYRNKVFYVGLEKQNQLLDVEGADGKRDVGIKIKCNEAYSKLSEDGVHFVKKNIFVFNSFNGIEFTNDGSISNFSDTVRDEEIKNFFSHIEDGMIEMYLQYNKELTELLTRINSLKNNIVSNESIEKFQNVIEHCGNAQIIIKNNDEAINTACQTIDTRNASKVRAAVNRNGYYDGCNVYDIYEVCSGETFDKNTKEYKDKLVGNVEEIFSKNDEFEDICKDILVERINSIYIRKNEANKQYVYNLVTNKMYNDIAWDTPYDFWGDGNGQYRKRVVDHIESYLTPVGKQIMDNKFSIEFFQEIIDFLSFDKL